jgi:hypothetical protein
MVGGGDLDPAKGGGGPQRALTAKHKCYGHYAALGSELSTLSLSFSRRKDRVFTRNDIGNHYKVVSINM